LKFEFDSALFQFALRGEKVFLIRAKSEVKHANLTVTGRFRFLARREQRDPGISLANKSRDAIPHPLVKSPEPENLGVPFHRSRDVAHADSHVINSFELHKRLIEKLEHIW